MLGKFTNEALKTVRLDHIKFKAKSRLIIFIANSDGKIQLALKHHRDIS